MKFFTALFFFAFISYQLSAQAPISSTFNVDAEGWTAPNSWFNVIYGATAGNPGGAIAGYDDDETNDYWAFMAPSKFLIDLTPYYNGSLTFDLTQAVNQPTPSTASFVTIVGSAGTIYFIPSTPPNPAVGSWSSYNIPINTASGQWRVQTCTVACFFVPATQAQINAVLSKVTDIAIRGKFGNVQDASIIDNIILHPPIVITTQPTSEIVCEGQTVTFKVEATGDGTLNYQWQLFNAATGGWNNLANTTVYSGVTTPALNVNTTGNAGAGSYRCMVSGVTPTVITNSVTLTVNARPTAPSTNGNSRCGTGTVVLSATNGSAGQYRWYTVATAGTPIPGQTNATYTTPSLSTTTPYYVSIHNGTCESTRTLSTATIITLPTAPSTTGASRCGTGTLTLTAAGGTNGQYRWYTVATLGTPLTEQSNTFTTPSLSPPTTYYVAINNGTCESTRTAVTAAVTTIPSAPTTTGGSSCGAGTATLTASGGAAGQYRWYTAATGGTAIPGETNATYSPSITTTTVYHVAINNGCEGARTAVTATLNTKPPAPTTTAVSRCGAGTVTLTAAGGAAGQYRWYTAATGGSPIASATSATYAPDLTATATYYAAINNGTCESNRTSVVATINTVPAKPVISSTATISNGVIQICQGSATLSAPAGFSSYLWSDNSTTREITVSQSGIFTVTVTNSDGCASSASDQVSVVISASVCNAPPVIDTKPLTSMIDGIVTLDLEELISDPDDNLDFSTLQIITPPSSGADARISGRQLIINYKGISFSGTEDIVIQVCDLLGVCTQQKLSIEVVGDIIINNGISPNNDGKNDIFLLQYIDILESTRKNKVTIFNRWGDPVFEVSDYNNTSNVFKGISSSGSDLPSGEYFYKIEFASGMATKTGYLSLRR